MKKDLMNITALGKKVEPLIRQSAKLLLSYRFKPLVRTEKQGAGFVTEADLATENFLIQELTKLDPSISFFTEENGDSRKKGNSGYCWVIDPLDGTTNFFFGLPHFCISVALTLDNKPVLGFVYQPLLDEMFYAEYGKGAYLNGKSIAVSKVQSLEEAFLLFCIPYGKNEGSKKLFEHVLYLSQKAYSMRLLGAAALDQAYVAAGRLDGMFFEQLAWWDVAAASLIIEEAGGKVSDYNGDPIRPGFKSFVAGNPYIHELLVEELKQ